MHIYLQKFADYAKMRISKTPYRTVQVFVTESAIDMRLNRRFLQNTMFINRKWCYKMRLLRKLERKRNHLSKEEKM